MKILIVLLLSGFTAFGQAGYISDTSITWRDAKITIDTGKIENVWIICAQKSRLSSVFSSPAILAQGVYLIRRRPGKYVPVPKTWKILTVIK